MEPTNTKTLSAIPECSVCRKLFKSSYHLHRHMARQHPQEVSEDAKLTAVVSISHFNEEAEKDQIRKKKARAEAAARIAEENARREEKERDGSSLPDLDFSQFDDVQYLSPDEPMITSLPNMPCGVGYGGQGEIRQTAAYKRPHEEIHQSNQTGPNL